MDLTPEKNNYFKGDESYGSIAADCSNYLRNHSCGENEVGLFEKPKYNERINKMEKQIRELEEKIFGVEQRKG